MALVVPHSGTLILHPPHSIPAHATLSRVPTFGPRQVPPGTRRPVHIWHPVPATDQSAAIHARRPVSSVFSTQREQTHSPLRCPGAAMHTSWHTFSHTPHAHTHSLSISLSSPSPLRNWKAFQFLLSEHTGIPRPPPPPLYVPSFLPPTTSFLQPAQKILTESGLGVSNLLPSSCRPRLDSLCLSLSAPDQQRLRRRKSSIYWSKIKKRRNKNQFLFNKAKGKAKVQKERKMSPTYTMSAHLCKQVYASWRQVHPPTPASPTPSGTATTCCAAAAAAAAASSTSSQPSRSPPPPRPASVDGEDSGSGDDTRSAVQRSRPWAPCSPKTD